MLPSTYLWLHAHACCQEEVIRPVARVSCCSISLQKSGGAPRPQTKAAFLILVATSAALPGAVPWTLRLSLSGSDLPALHSVYVQAGTWAGAWKEPQSSLGFGEPKHGPMLQRGLGPKMVKMALPHFGVFVLKWAVLSFQECWLFPSPGEAGSPLGRGCVWKVLCLMT